MDKPEILIVGGTGQVGRELIALLAKKETRLRVLVRKRKVPELENQALIETMPGDLEDEDSLKKAMTGTRQVFLLSRDQPQQAELESRLISLAKPAGVEMILKSSAFAAGLEPPVGYGLTHAGSERVLMDSGVKWAILRPYMFMQNFLEIADLVKSKNLVPMPLGSAGIGLVDSRDVALAASALLTGSGELNRIYELTGPESITMKQLAAKMSALLQRKIRYLSPPYFVAGLMMRMQGVDAWNVRMRGQLFRMIREGGEDRVTKDFEDLLGHQPRTLEQFFDDHLSYFQ